MKHCGSTALAMVLLVGGCARQAPAPLLGTLEWERVSVISEASEPIVRVDVIEGAVVEAGATILALDTRRIAAHLEHKRAEVQRARSALIELQRGARSETIAAARSTLAGADAATANARRERDRLAEVRKRGLVAQADLDRAETALRGASAQAGATRANLGELLNGTRVEDIEQAEAVLDAAQADLQHLELTGARYEVRAPRAGRVDALPYKLGDQAPTGAVLVSLLSGSAYARVYVPASRRVQLDVGARCNVHVQGIAEPLAATLRSVRSDPAFTPYYALTGDDASRLAYRAEIVLDTPPKNLPAGLPVQAECATSIRAAE